MSDNEHTLASLRQTGILSVKHSPGAGSLAADADTGIAPASGGDGGSASGDGFEDDGEIFTLVGGEQARDILEEKPGGSESINETYELVEKAGVLASQSSTASSDREVGAGASPCDEVHAGKVGGVNIPDVMVPPGVGEVSAQHGEAGRLDLDLVGAAPAGIFEGAINAT